MFHKPANMGNTPTRPSYTEESKDEKVDRQILNSFRVNLEYFGLTGWVYVSNYPNENIAWAYLGGDDFNYRTVNAETGRVLTDKSK